MLLLVVVYYCLLLVQVKLLYLSDPQAVVLTTSIVCTYISSVLCHLQLLYLYGKYINNSARHNIHIRSHVAYQHLQFRNYIILQLAIIHIYLYYLLLLFANKNVNVSVHYHLHKLKNASKKRMYNTAQLHHALAGESRNIITSLPVPANTPNAYYQPHHTQTQRYTPQQIHRILSWARSPFPPHYDLMGNYVQQLQQRSPGHPEQMRAALSYIRTLQALLQGMQSGEVLDMNQMLSKMSRVDGLAMDSFISLM